eukprot:TRINITY_DN14251_c0_g1_i1.p1 TRINITY_DN14251_c0_g1~~TRINITY_DN14251_c0_g1_i1.p1  ORF type:complete len:488 (+),score=111.04 TRINITY_DN14251_c0_g1_i1:142-1605(+)
MLRSLVGSEMCIRDRWNNGVMSGEGSCEFVNGDLYAGNWEGGQLDGVGTYSWVDGDRYHGNFSKNQLEGRGSFVGAGKRAYSFTGLFRNGKFKQRMAKTFMGQRAVNGGLGGTLPRSPVRGVLTDCLGSHGAESGVCMHPVVFLGPEAGGKHSIMTRLIEEYPHLVMQPLRHTTRLPQDWEMNGLDAHFVDDVAMAALSQKDAASSISVELLEAQGVITTALTLESVEQASYLHPRMIPILTWTHSDCRTLKLTDLNARYVFVSSPTKQEAEKDGTSVHNWEAETPCGNKLDDYHLVLTDPDLEQVWTAVCSFLQLGPPASPEMRATLQQNKRDLRAKAQQDQDMRSRIQQEEEAARQEASAAAVAEAERESREAAQAAVEANVTDMRATIIANVNQRAQKGKSRGDFQQAAKAEETVNDKAEATVNDAPVSAPEAETAASEEAMAAADAEGTTATGGTEGAAPATEVPVAEDEACLLYTSPSPRDS